MGRGPDRQRRRRRSCDGGGATLEEVAEALGCTRQNVSQIEQKALRKLRNHPDAARLRDFLDAPLQRQSSTADMEEW